MLTLPLEPTDDRAEPIFKDAAACTRWLSQLQLTNLQLAHSQLLTQLNELNRYPMRGLERLGTLESLRETVGFIQADFAKKLIDKPLPLNDGELLVFMSIVQLWQALVTGYQRCLQAFIAGDKQLLQHGALLCQRCLLYSGLEILEHLRTGYEFDARLWRQLHELYYFAEQQGLHTAAVADPLGTQGSCVSCYVKTLLICFASPAQLTRWQSQQLDHWLSLWSDTVTVTCSYKPSKNDAQPLAVDLSGSKGLQRADGMPHHDVVRYLTMAPLSKLLRVKTILLQQGQTPKQVGLGDHYDSYACLEFLALLHRYWCENKLKRSGERRPRNQQVQLCYKPEGIYTHLTGKPLNPQDRNFGIDSLARKQIETLGHALHSAQHRERMETGYPLENWQMKNESISGTRLIREDTTGGRLHCRQLIALRPLDAQSFMLGAIVWANVTQQGKLEIGVKYLPGRPEPVYIRASGINPTADSAPAFLLPALPALKTPASLVIPRNWLRPERIIEVLHPNGETGLVQLGFSVEHGLDYERVSYKASSQFTVAS